MRILIASKALVVGAYQRKLEEIAAQPGVDHLTAVVPPFWQEPGGRKIEIERAHTSGYDLRVEPVWFNGSFHLFCWPRLGRLIRETRADVVHLDEEPFNLATALEGSLEFEIAVCGNSSSAHFTRGLEQAGVRVFRSAASRDCQNRKRFDLRAERRACAHHRTGGETVGCSRRDTFLPAGQARCDGRRADRGRQRGGL